MKNIDPDEVQPDDKLIRLGSRALVLRRRTEPVDPERTAAVNNLKAEVARVLLPVVEAIDHALRKWPWLYRRLGGDI